MKKPISMEAYEDCLRHFERALASERGIKISCTTHGQAMSLRMRMNKLRLAIRDQNTAIYPPGHPQRGVTAFDELMLSVDKSDVIVTKRVEPKVEEL